MFHHIGNKAKLWKDVALSENLQLPSILRVKILLGLEFSSIRYIIMSLLPSMSVLDFSRVYSTKESKV